MYCIVLYMFISYINSTDNMEVREVLQVQVAIYIMLVSQIKHKGSNNYTVKIHLLWNQAVHRYSIISVSSL
jgi:hypothetical protein